MTILAQTRCLQKTEYRYVFAVGLPTLCLHNKNGL